MPGCKIAAWWDGHWGDLGTLNQYWEVLPGQRFGRADDKKLRKQPLHFCSAACLAKWAVARLEEELVERTQQFNQEYLANFSLKHPEETSTSAAAADEPEQMS
jgi:hypothetical protein